MVALGLELGWIPAVKRSTAEAGGSPASGRGPWLQHCGGRNKQIPKIESIHFPKGGVGKGVGEVFELYRRVSGDLVGRTGGGGSR